MMNKVKFGEVMDLFANAFLCGDMFESAKAKDVWYKYLGDYVPEVLENAVDEAVRTELKRPPISRLLELCEKHKREWEEHQAWLHRNDGLDMVLGINDPGFDDDRAAHPFENGWRINDDGYWVRVK